jgi:hypothetical protein
MKKMLFGLGVVGLGLLAVGDARASFVEVIYDNGGPNQLGGSEMTRFIQAEDFVLSAATKFTDVRFWSLELPVGYQGSFVWQIYGDNAGQPGSLLNSGEAVPLRRSTGKTFGAYQEYENTFSAGIISLGAGTYWLGLHNGPLTTATLQNVRWETTGQIHNPTGFEDATPFGVGPWEATGLEHAFQLGVPEPSQIATGVLLLGGVAGYVVRRRRAKSNHAAPPLPPPHRNTAL